MPAELELPEVARIEPRDAAGDRLQRLSTRLARPAHRRSERVRNRVSGGSPRHQAVRRAGQGRGVSNRIDVVPMERVPGNGRTVIGVDLGGARMATAGIAVLSGTDLPRATSASRLPKATTAERAERRLLEVIEDARPDVVAMDAPLTLPR